MIGNRSTAVEGHWHKSCLQISPLYLYCKINIDISFNNYYIKMLIIIIITIIIIMGQPDLNE